jgi:hypothetical protein
MSNPSPSLQDGFHGARDAKILRESTFVARDTRRVQATKLSMDLLKRSGIKQPKMHELYEVKVERHPKFDGLQLAPLPIA